MPCSISHPLITDSSWLSALGQFQNFPETYGSSQSSGGAGSAQAPAACMLLLVAPHHRTDTQPSFHPAPFPGFAGRQQRADVWARVQFQDPVLSLDPLCCYTSFCASPSHCWLCSLVPNEHSSVFQSGCGLLHTATTQRAERQSTERSFPFLQHRSSGKNHSQDRSGLLNHCSCPGCSCLASPQGQHSIKSLEDSAAALHRVSQVRAALFRALQSWPHTVGFMRLAKAHPVRQSQLSA